MFITTDSKYLKQVYVDLLNLKRVIFYFFFGPRFYTKREILKENPIEKMFSSLFTVAANDES